MTEYEIRNIISSMMTKVINVGLQINEIENDIEILKKLKIRCSDYQIEFENSRRAIKNTVKNSINISGQDAFLEEYNYAVGIMLDGKEYMYAYESLSDIKDIIENKIQKLTEHINSFNIEISGLNSKIYYYNQELTKIIN